MAIYFDADDDDRSFLDALPVALPFGLLCWAVIAVVLWWVL
jgi:hypothetical protein